MRIAQVSKQYDISPDTLRYYERIGLLPPVARNKSGVRDYSPFDCNWIRFIKCMRGAGLPIEVLIEYVKLFSQGDDTIAARKELLQEQRDALAAKIAELTETLARLDHKISSYEQTIIAKERKLRKEIKCDEK